MGKLIHGHWVSAAWATDLFIFVFFFSDEVSEKNWISENNATSQLRITPNMAYIYAFIEIYVQKLTLLMNDLENIPLCCSIYDILNANCKLQSTVLYWFWYHKRDCHEQYLVFIQFELQINFMWYTFVYEKPNLN